MQREVVQQPLSCTRVMLMKLVEQPGHVIPTPIGGAVMVAGILLVVAAVKIAVPTPFFRAKHQRVGMLSSNPVGMAAQFKEINGRFLRGLILWMARAINSFPVPVSPRISTVASVGATTSTCLVTLFMAVLPPTISSKLYWTSTISLWIFSSRSRSRRSFTNVIQRKGDIVRTEIGRASCRERV